VEVLVEGLSKAAQKHDEGSPHVQLTGRTSCDRIVVFEGNRRQIGQIMPVEIYDHTPFTLFGEVVTCHAGPEVYSLGLVTGR
jgi:tRNA-2-methylthio-N6-dimethylallyladenosine synthase